MVARLLTGQALDTSSKSVSGMCVDEVPSRRS